MSKAQASGTPGHTEFNNKVMRVCAWIKPLVSCFSFFFYHPWKELVSSCRSIPMFVISHAQEKGLGEFEDWDNAFNSSLRAKTAFSLARKFIPIKLLCWKLQKSGECVTLQKELGIGWDALRCKFNYSSSLYLILISLHKLLELSLY